MPFSSRWGLRASVVSQQQIFASAVKRHSTTYIPCLRTSLTASLAENDWVDLYIDCDIPSGSCVPDRSRTQLRSHNSQLITYIHSSTLSINLPCSSSTRASPRDFRKCMPWLWARPYASSSYGSSKDLHRSPNMLHISVEAERTARGWGSCCPRAIIWARLS